MTPKPDLFELIHSLTDQEANAFRKEVLSRKGRHVYLQVFDAILEQEEYDERALKKQFKGEKTLNNFSIAKNNLYEKLMDVLCQLPHHQTIDTLFDSYKQQISILVKKSLYKQAMSRVRKAIKQAEKVEAYQKIMDMNELQREIARNFLAPSKYLELLTELRNKESWLREVNLNLHQYKNVFDTVAIAQKVPEKMRNTIINSILQHPLMQDESECLSVSARLYFYRIWNYIYIVQGKDSGWKYFTENIVNLLENHKYLLSDPGKFLVYVNTISDFGLNCIAAGQHAAALESAEKLMQISKGLKTGDNEALIFGRYWKIQMVYFLRQLDIKHGLQAIGIIEDGLKSYKGKLSKILEMELTHIIAVFLLTVERPSEAIRWILQLREDKVSTNRPDIHYFSWILFLVGHFNLGHLDVIEQQINRTISYLKDHRFYQDREKAILQFFKKAPNTRNRVEMRNLLTDVLEHISSYDQETHGQSVRLLDFFDLQSWIRARLDNEPMHQWMQRHGNRPVSSMAEE